MSYAPATITELAAYWTHHKGVNLGIVGSASHTGGYHLGKDRLKNRADYSIQTARDKRGFKNAAAALDLGRLAGSLHNLQEFSKWFVGRCRANATGTRDVREVIYSPDGTAVLRWDRERGYGSAPRSGESDTGHRTHTHIGFYRDSETRTKLGLFAAYFAPQEADMPSLVSYIPGHIAVIMAADGAKVRAAPTLAADVIRTIASDTSESWTVTGWVKGDASGGSDAWLTRWAAGAGRWEYTHKSNVASVAPPPPPPDTTPYDQAALDAATKAGETTNEAKWRVWLDSAPKP